MVRSLPSRFKTNVIPIRGANAHPVSKKARFEDLTGLLNKDMFDFVPRSQNYAQSIHKSRFVDEIKNFCTARAVKEVDLCCLDMNIINMGLFKNLPLSEDASAVLLYTSKSSKHNSASQEVT